MGTKQVQLPFSVYTNPGQTVNAIVFVNDVQKYAGPLADMSDIVTFDLDVVDQQILTYVQPGYGGQWTTPMAFSITIENGTVTLLKSKANYTGYIQSVPEISSIYVPGSLSDYQSLWFASQPLWNGVADLSRYNFDETNPELGPLEIKNNETVTYQLSMTQWADE